MPTGTSVFKFPKFKLVLPLLAAGLFLSSCVSRSKYETALDQRDRYKTNYEEVARENARMRAQAEMLTVKVNENLADNYQQCTHRLSAAGENLAEAYDKLYAYETAMDVLSDSLESQFALFLPEEIELTRDRGQLRVAYETGLFYETGSTRLSENGKAMLTDLADLLQYHSDDFYVNVIGHADHRKTHGVNYRDNWSLSMKRALSVVRHLEEAGVNPEIMTASARSYFDPLAEGHDKLDHALNRRTEIIFIPKIQKEMYEVLFSSK